MKKIHAVNLCIIVIIFLTAGVSAKPDTESQDMKQNISDRIMILNRYYSGEETLDKTRTALENIETGTILKDDVKQMKLYSRTDMDQITDSKVKILSCKETSFGILKGKAKISYVMKGQQGSRKETHHYFFTAEKEKKTRKLTQLKPI